jgi:hypothetical protein
MYTHSSNAKFLQIVLLNCPHWEKGKGYFHVLEVLQCSGEVKFFDVKAHVTCILCAYHTVPVEFFSVEVGRENEGIAIIIDQIASRCDSDAVGIIFLRLVIHDRICIKNFLAARACLISSCAMTNIAFVPF